MHTHNTPSNQEITADNFLSPGEKFEVVKDKKQLQELQEILTITTEKILLPKDED